MTFISGCHFSGLTIISFNFLLVEASHNTLGFGGDLAQVLLCNAVMITLQVDFSQCLQPVTKKNTDPN